MDEFQNTVIAILSGVVLCFLYALLVMVDVFLGDEEIEEHKEG